MAPPDDPVSLRQHFEAMLREQDLRYQQRFDAQTLAMNAALLEAKDAIRAALMAQKEAVQKSEVAADKRFDLLNELRVGVATRDQFESMNSRLVELHSRMDKHEATGKGLRDGWGYLVGGAGLLLAAAAWFAK